MLPALNDLPGQLKKATEILRQLGFIIDQEQAVKAGLSPTEIDCLANFAQSLANSAKMDTTPALFSDARGPDRQARAMRIAMWDARQHGRDRGIRRFCEEGGTPTVAAIRAIEATASAERRRRILAATPEGRDFLRKQQAARK